MYGKSMPEFGRQVKMTLRQDRLQVPSRCKGVDTHSVSQILKALTGLTYSRYPRCQIEDLVPQSQAPVGWPGYMM